MQLPGCVKEAKGMRSAEKRRRGRARVFFLLLLVFSFPAPAESQEGTGGLPDSPVIDYRLTNFHIIDADIADALEGLAGIARARGGNLYALVDRRAVRALPVNVKLREGIGLAEALEELARVHGYSCYWDFSAGAVVIGNEQSFRDYETMETRLYDPGLRTLEEFLNALAAVVPRERLEVALSGGLLQVTTGSLEHRIIREKLSALRSGEEEGITLEIKVKTLAAAGGGIRGLFFSRQPVPSAPYFARLSREELAAAGALTGGESPEETLRLYAVLYKNNRQFIGEILPAVAADGREAAAVDYRPVGVTLDLTLLGRTENGVTLALQAEVNRIMDWRETEGGTPVPVVATEEAGAGFFLREGEVYLFSGPALAPGGWKGRAADPVRTGSSRVEELLFGSGQGPGEKRDLALFINFLPGGAGIDYPGYAQAAGEEPAPVLPVSERPAAMAGAKEEETPKAAESPIATGSTPVESATTVESSPVWAAEVIELGTLSQTGGPAPEPEKPETPAPLTGGETGVAGEPLAWEEPAAEEVVETTAGYQERPAGEEGQAVEEKVVAEERPATGKGPGGPEPFLPGTSEVGLVITYRTKEGEDLPAIADKYGIPVEALYRSNNLSPDALLPAGTNLVVPIPVDHLYLLQQGETLWRLARRYGVSLELLMEINQISDVTQLMIGQIIILPKPVDQVDEKN